MSKKFILLILCLTLLPIVLFLIFNEEEITTVAPVELPSAEETKAITIPIPGTTGSTSQQCAVCAQISDSNSKEQCLKDFACS